jgi:hypothetical protein
VGAGATDRHSNLHQLKLFLMALLATLLFLFVALREGIMNMLREIAIEVAVYFAMTVGSRVKRRV